MLRFVIPGQLPGLNELIAARAVVGITRGRGGKRYSRYSALKRDAEARVLAAIPHGALPFQAPVCVLFAYRERVMRRDPDNIDGGARKIILDALVRAGVLPNDSRKWIVGLAATWTTHAPCDEIEVTVAEAAPL